jgi:iron complex transport system permease protein
VAQGIELTPTSTRCGRTWSGDRPGGDDDGGGIDPLAAAPPARRAVALGADSAIGLGIDWSRVLIGLLLLVALLVAVSTALVGPVTFLGLLVVAIAERVVDSRRHFLLLPAAVLTAVVVLVGGQAVLQHGLGQATTLGVVIEFVGGLVFLGMLLAAGRR